ncbi:MAG: hypothetical protein KAH86_06495 [Methanosarcinales archaeon]|nr:hypothetical protein [Methanosarcinales archaeon]
MRNAENGRRVAEWLIRHMMNTRPPGSSHGIGGREGGVTDVSISVRPAEKYI